MLRMDLPLIGYPHSLQKTLGKDHRNITVIGESFNELCLQWVCNMIGHEKGFSFREKRLVPVRFGIETLLSGEGIRIGRPRLLLEFRDILLPCLAALLLCAGKVANYLTAGHPFCKEPAMSCEIAA